MLVTLRGFMVKLSFSARNRENPAVINLKSQRYIVIVKILPFEFADIS